MSEARSGSANGDAEQLLAAVYKELRQLAASKMANEAAGHTLQPTALVHEAWLRLTRQEDKQFENRAHFFAAAAEAMRRILIEHARRRKALRHGAGQVRVDLNEAKTCATKDEDQLLLVNDVLDRFAALFPVEAEVVKLRYFVGLTHGEIAATLNMSVRTVKNYWAHARAWLYQEITARQN